MLQRTSNLLNLTLGKVVFEEQVCTRLLDVRMSFKYLETHVCWVKLGEDYKYSGSLDQGGFTHFQRPRDIIGGVFATRK